MAPQSQDRHPRPEFALAVSPTADRRHRPERGWTSSSQLSHRLGVATRTLARRHLVPLAEADALIGSSLLDKLFGEFPILGHPVEVSEPPPEDLVEGWTVEVVVDDAYVESYRVGDPDRVVRLDLLTNPAK